MDDTHPLNGALLARLRFIDFIADHFGVIQRRHIMDYFGLSEPQASHDLTRYRELAPANLKYDSTRRAWVRDACFVRQFP